jgi:hypothetical protein
MDASKRRISLVLVTLALLMLVVLVSEPFLRQYVNTMAPPRLVVGDVRCNLTNGWYVKVDANLDGFYLKVLNRHDPAALWSRKQTMQIITDLPPGLRTLVPADAAMLNASPFGRMRFVRLERVAGQPRIGNFARSRYVGVFEGGEVYFESEAHLLHGICKPEASKSVQSDNHSPHHFNLSAQRRIHSLLAQYFIE